VSPNPGGSGYGGTFAARPELHNARGLSSTIVPKFITLPGGREPDRNPGPKPKGPVALPGSESYNYAIGIVSLPGRNGLVLGIALVIKFPSWVH
jgi:hypothetical protein